jgi:plastocyanin
VRALIAVLVVIAALATAPVSSAKTVLKGTVGPGFTIKLTTAAGKPVKTLKAGTYVFIVSDKSAIHNFHLIGPGVNKQITSIGFTGTKTIVLKLKAGKYIYQCDPHSGDMKASFIVKR